jgi:FkbM family methyltransferase
MIEFLNSDRNTCNIDMLVDVQLQRLRKTCRKGEYFAVHVGSYIGNVDKYFMQRNKDVVVHAIEPCKRNFRLLREVGEMYPRLKAHRLLLGDVDGKGSLYVNAVNKLGEERASSQSNSVYPGFANPKQAETQAKVEVPMSTMSTFLRRNVLSRVDYLRLNCEGGEYKILAEGQSNKWLKKTNIVAVTWHGKHSNFLTQEFINKRIFGENLLTCSGLTQIMGFNFTGMKKLPVGHVWQVWTRKRFLS